MKDAYYFSHDSNAKDDPKCVLLIEQLGPEGYGIFWILIETLRDQPDFKYPLKLLSALARRYNTTAEKIKAVVVSYDLFIIENDTFFFSESLNRRMILFQEKRKKLSEAGKKGAQIKINQAQAKLKPGSSHPAASKENKMKEKNITSSIEYLYNSIPTDGKKRNLKGLVLRLQKYNLSTDDILNIVSLSDYGAIGNIVWQLLNTVDESNGKIRMPGKFILSRLAE
jgi:hypothetical protein